MKKLLLLLIFVLQIGLLIGQNDFSFVFLPDTHLRPDSAIEANFDNIVMKINKLHPDFVIAGGDMIYTAKNVDEEKAKVLFDLMDTKFRQFDMPVYYTMGNHEIVGVLAESGMEISDPMWGKGMYEKLYGKRYQSFIYSGWKFFLLDGIKILVISDSALYNLTGFFPNNDDKALRSLASLSSKIKSRYYVIQMGCDRSFVYDGHAYETVTAPPVLVPAKSKDGAFMNSTYMGALTTEYLESRNIIRACKYAGIVSLLSRTANGSLEHVPSKEEVDCFMAANRIDLLHIR